MQPATITPEERNRMTDQNAHLFIARHVIDYFPCPANSQKICDFIISQVGADYPYHWPIDFFENAFAYISEHSWFYQRPVEEEVEDPAVTRERLAQERVRTDHAARVKAETIARDKVTPLNELGAKVSQQNVDFREQRDRNELPTRTPGLESRSLATVTFGDKAAARANVALANPSLPRDGAEFSRLYAAELARLRG